MKHFSKSKTAERLKEIRKAKGLTVNKVSKRLYMGDHVLYRIERGESTPSIDQLIDLSQIYGTSLENFIMYDDTPRTRPEEDA